MSKSLGNVIAPQKVADTLGAEIIRLWVTSTDYSGELSLSDEILKRVVEGYRRLRNTLRFLLANVSDFDPARDMLPVDGVAGDRPLRAGDDAAGVGEVAGRLRPLRVPPDRRSPADLRVGGPRRVLARHPEGPSVHDAAALEGAALGAVGALPHHRRAAEADGAAAVVHRRGSVEGARRRAPAARSSRKPTRRCRRCRTKPRWSNAGPRCAPSAPRCRSASRNCARRERSARRCRPRSSCARPAERPRCCSRSATTCASS